MRCPYIYYSPPETLRDPLMVSRKTCVQNYSSWFLRDGDIIISDLMISSSVTVPSATLGMISINSKANFVGIPLASKLLNSKISIPAAIPSKYSKGSHPVIFNFGHRYFPSFIKVFYRLKRVSGCVHRRWRSASP